MTEKLNTQLSIPAWLVPVLAIVFIAYMGFFTAQVKAQQTTATKVEIMEAELKLKADNTDIERIYRTLDRIETKIDKQNSK
jgi:hypothetical protein